jgi:hypothetical protein
MSKCKIFGYIEDGSETPAEGINIQFFPAALPAINSSTGKGIWPVTLETTTTSTGYFEQELVVNTDFVVIINSLGLKEKIRVPDLTEKNLFELTGAYTVGDPTPSDDGEENW